MPCGFRFNESDQVLFKKKYVACFWLLESWRRNAFLQALNSRVWEITEKELYPLGIFWQIRYRLYFNDKNHV